MGVAVTAVAVWLMVLSAYDIRHCRLPNALTLPGAAVIIAVAALNGSGAAATAGAAALFGLYLCLHLMSPTGLGGGDVKLALGLGALTGCFGTGVWFLGAVGAPVLTLLCGLCTQVVRPGRHLPHGPSMCVASALAVALALA